MKSDTRYRILILFLLLFPGLSLAGVTSANDTFEKKVPLEGPVVLDVDTGSGSIVIRAGSGREATIRGEIHVRRHSIWRKAADTEELIQRVKDNPPVEVSDGRLRVGHFRDRELGNKVSISYEIIVPADTAVVAETGSGSITIDDIAAPVEAETGSGRIRMNNIGGHVRAEAGSGSIRAEKVAGGFEADTGSGSIYLSQTAPGDVVVSTGSGSSELIGVTGAVRASAGSGRIIVEGRQEGLWNLESGSGSVRVRLPADAAFDLDAETNSGGIVVDHPLTVEGRISKRHIRGAVRGGGPLLRIDTGSGGIRIE